MIDPSTAQTVYNDMGALADLRSRARANPNEAVEDVAQQFEALFIHQLLKQARSAKLADDILGSEAGDTYTEMLDQERAKQLSAQMNLGIADALVSQFNNRVKK